MERYTTRKLAIGGMLFCGAPLLHAPLNKFLWRTSWRAPLNSTFLWRTWRTCATKFYISVAHLAPCVLWRTFLHAPPKCGGLAISANFCGAWDQMRHFCGVWSKCAIEMWLFCGACCICATKVWKNKKFKKLKKSKKIKIQKKLKKSK